MSRVSSVCVAVVISFGLLPAVRADDLPRPNVLVILADDLGFSDLGSYGGEIDTPNLDRLAAGGLRFTQGYNTARCWPTRAALLTGYYPQAIQRDALPGGQGGLQGKRPAWATLLPERLAAAGYRSYHSGKWHIDGDPRAQGFARSLDVLGAGQSNYFDPAGVTEDGRPIVAGDDFYTTTAIGDHAVKCLAEHARDHAGTPFFHYVAFTAPHFPVQAPADVVAKYRQRYLAGWDAVRAARAARLRASGIVTTTPAEPEPDVGPPHQPKPETLARLGAGELDRPRPWDSLTEEQRQFQATKMAIHAAMIDIMDREAGRIIAQLEAMGTFENTLVLFLSDNGASAEILIRGEGHDPTATPGSRKTFLCLGPGWSSAANTPFRRHKTWVHEGGIATPWIVHWPAGIAAKGELRRQPVHAIDLVPTVLELARAPEQAASSAPPLQGRSFAAALSSAAAPAAHESLWWCHEGHRAVRMGDWKLVAARGDPWELYDLAADRCETSNLAAANPDRVAALEKEWNRIAAECRAMAPAARPEAARANGARPRPLAGRRPNIIYVMTDDQGYGDVAAHGNGIIHTPNLDRLRDQSVRLTEFHVSPTCAPTRAALLTGRHEFRSGVTHTILERERLALDAVTLPQLLRRTAGYTTGIFGKWHLGDEDAYQPGRRGFDRVFIHGGGGIGQSYPGSCGDAPGNTYFDPVIRRDGEFVRTKGYCTDVFFGALLDWIDRCRQEQKPFFCYLTPNCPHSPYDCPPGSDEKYLGPLEAAGIKDPKQRATIARFYAMIENIDTNMGRLLAKLDEWGLAEDTLLVFSTDNGTAAGGPVFNDGMRGTKCTPYRGGTRVPAFWRWPGTLPAGVDIPAVTAHIDVLPTLCELAGATIPPAVAAKVEGRSLVPLLEDAEAAWPARLLVTHVGRWDRGKAAESGYRNCRIREGRWQLVNTKNRPGAWELYDLAADPGEQQSVAAEHPDVVARLARAYDSWWAGVQGDLVNEDLDGPKENPFKVAFHEQFGPAATAAPADGPPAAARPARRPNIIFFLCDDLGTGDVGALGGRDIQTPNIDALFARGTRLTRHWAGNAVCAPSRCVLLTGKHPGHAVVRSNREVKPEGQFPMPAGTVTLATILRDAGYATGGFGKWGLGAPGSASDPVACGFDRFYGYNCQREAHTFYPGHLWNNRERVLLDNRALSGDPQVARGGTVPPEAAGNEAAFAKFSGTQYAADLIAQEQLAFIRAHAARPFFLYVPTTVPHLALQVPADEPSLADYEKHFGEEQPYLGGRGYVPCRRPLATYAAMITRMDREVGRIVGLLDELGLSDDTIFVFTSDNGATGPGTGGIDTARLKSNGDSRQWKGSPYEGGLRVPTAIAWPGKIPAGKTLATPTGFEDWMPTLLDLAGLHEKIPADGDGVSLAAALEGKAAAPADRFLYRELTEGRWQAVTDGRWKAVRRGAGLKNPQRAAPTELFDLSVDASETSDVAGKHPEIVRRLEALMDREHVPHPDWPLPFADAAKRPNILFIIADDQSPFDLKAYDPASRLETPVLDALAARGCVLDAAYHMGSFSGAVCTPSRHMIMTGRSVWHLPIGPGRRRCPTDIEDHVLAAVFNAAGYDTMRTCKQGNSYEAANKRFTVRHDATRREGTAEGGSAWHADRVLDFLAARESAGDRDPFLISFGFSHPHDTRDGTPELLAKYGATNHTDQSRPPPPDAKQPPLPANWLPEHPFDTTHMDVRDEVAVSGVWRRRDEATIRNELGREFACSENIDIQIGRVLDKLRAMGELDNTWIVYTADHGMAIGRHGLQGKQNLYEHTWRVPLIVAGPGVKPGSRAPGNVYLADVLATLCDIAGIAPPATNEGRSFLPVLTGAQPTVRDVLYGAYSGGAKPGIRCVRRGDWKLVKYESPAGGLVTQLFNLRENPAEFLTEHRDPAVTAVSHAVPAPHQQNLADDPAHAATRREMEALLLAEMVRHDDPARFSDQPNIPAAPPNVVVIFIDDLGYGDIGPFGATRQKTPHLDRMAAEGRTFTSFYAAPACSVSRAQLLTGCYGPRVGDPWVYFPADPRGLNPAEVTIAERLRPLGYATACIGKWHLGDQPEFLPTKQGFDRYVGIPYSNDMQKVSAKTGERVVPLVRDEQVAELLTDEDQRRIVERLTDEAVWFIAESKDRPFFLYLPHTAVHLPLFPGRAFAGRTDNGPFGDWVEEVDWSVGRVLDALREQGLDEKTLVIFTSDNGPWIGPVEDFTSAGPLRGSKGSTWEGGVRVPTIARWPGRIPAGTTCDAVCGTIDLLPTFVALAGGTVPAEPVIDGRDMSGLLFGTATQSPREAHYYFSPGELQAVRAGRWKLAVAGQPEGMSRKGPKVPASLDAPRLYDLEADLGETTDVAAAHPEEVTRLRGMAERMRAELVEPASAARRPPGQVAHPTTLYPVRERPAAAPPPLEPKAKRSAPAAGR